MIMSKEKDFIHHDEIEARYPVEIYYAANGNIHTTNIIDEDDDYYYTVPVRAIRRIPKLDAYTDIKELLKDVTIWKLENDIPLSRYKRKVLQAEVIKELEKTHAEYFI